MKNILPIILLLFVFGCTQKMKKAPQVSAGKVISIDTDVARLGPCEPSIAINGQNTDEIIVGSILDRLYTSKDGGVSWDVSRLDSKYGVFGDPVVGVDGKGNYYYAHLSNPDGRAYASESFLDRIVVQKSTDKGKTWNEGTFPPADLTKDQDKHWYYIDPVTNIIHMTWTEFDSYGKKDNQCFSRILYSQSSDEANTWSEPVTVSNQEGNCIDDDQTTEGALPVVDADGNVHVIWAYDSKLFINTSTDNGKSWLSKERAVANQYGGWVLDIPGLNRCNGMPVLKIDNSKGKKKKGTMYVNWADQKNGSDDTDIWLKKSTDGGKTWSSRIKINDDKSGRHQFLTWMDVDPVTGYIYIVFYDRRNTEGNATDVYLAYSTDEGNTFTNVKINEASFTPVKEIFFGDYNNIAARNGVIRPVWTEYKDYMLSVKTALISVE